MAAACVGGFCGTSSVRASVCSALDSVCSAVATGAMAATSSCSRSAVVGVAASAIPIPIPIVSGDVGYGQILGSSGSSSVIVAGRS